MRNPEQIKQAGREWEKSKAAWTKDKPVKPEDNTVRPYDSINVINTGESWKD